MSCPTTADPARDGDVAPADGRSPRRAGDSPQGLAMTLLADYGLRARHWIPSGAVVELLGEFGVTPGGARAAISRLARSGMLESTRQGRRTSYRLTPSAAHALAWGGAAIARFPDDAELWDDRWTLVAFSMPEAGEAPRRALRAHLRWFGFAPLYDGLWVSPLPLPQGALEGLQGVPPGAITVFRAWVEADVAGRDPLDAWDLAGIGLRYRAFIDRWSPLLARVRDAAVPGAEALLARTEVMDTYRHFLALDPRLPLRRMPAGWPRQEAREVFTGIYDGLLGTALRHVVETVARYADGSPPPVAGHTVAELAAGLPQAGAPS